MLSLVIPDIHHKTERAQKIIDSHPDVDRRIFLGDIYDDFGDNPHIAARTARWHKEALKDPKNIFCMGNHDMPYRFRNSFLLCSGWTWQKHQAINEILTKEDWNKHVLYVDDQGWLLSHAGVHPKFYKGLEKFKLLCDQTMSWIVEGKKPVLLGAGYYRGGDQVVGGITWLDWNGEFEPIEGLKQIVGHTPGKTPREKSDNWCLDTHLNHFALIEDGEIIICGVDD